MGRERSYLADYEVEIAEDAVTSNPIVQRVLAGVVLNVNAGLSSTGDSATLGVRFSRTWLTDPLRVVKTQNGEIQVPELRVVRLRTDLEVPFGATAVVGSAGDAGRRTLLLLTPRLKRE